MSETNPIKQVPIDRKVILKKVPRQKVPVEMKRKKALFACVLCQRKFTSHLSLKEHFRNHGQNNIDLRGLPAHKSTLLKYPKKDDNNLQLIYCEFCPEVSPSISKAIQHKFRKHRTEGPNYFCEFCGKLFPIKVAFEQHKKTAHPETKQKEKEKKNGSRLGSVIKQEGAENPQFKCTYCPAVFIIKEAKDFHEDHVHRFSNNLLLPIFVPPPSTKIKLNNSSEVFSVYYCHLCGSEYIMKFNLKKHLQDNHTVEERNRIPIDGIIRCKTCEAIFYSEKAYTVHCIHHRPGDWHVTSEEQRQRIVARVDQDFDFRRVPLKGEEFPMLISRRKRQPQKKTQPSTSKVEKESDDEPMSPPSVASDSSEEDTSKSPKENAEDQPK